ncbi:hypothetical protein BH24CHL1_BH24CHL1_00740 [soil metagenome]
MNIVWLILTMGAGVYSLRLVGLVLPDVTVPASWEQALRFVPIALLTSLVVLNLTRTSQVNDGLIRIIAACGAIVVARLTGQMWACILGGMMLYWFLGLI